MEKPGLAQYAILNTRTGELIIDGEPFPWAISDAVIHASASGATTITLTLPVRRGGEVVDDPE